MTDLGARGGRPQQKSTAGRTFVKNFDYNNHSCNICPIFVHYLSKYFPIFVQILFNCCVRIQLRVFLAKTTEKLSSNFDCCCWYFSTKKIAKNYLANFYCCLFVVHNNKNKSHPRQNITVPKYMNGQDGRVCCKVSQILLIWL